MKRTVIELPYPNNFAVIGDSQKVLNNLIGIAMQRVKTSLDYQQLMEKFVPRGSGISIADILWAFWVANKEEVSSSC